MTIQGVKRTILRDRNQPTSETLVSRGTAWGGGGWGGSRCHPQRGEGGWQKRWGNKRMRRSMSYSRRRVSENETVE